MNAILMSPRKPQCLRAIMLVYLARFEEAIDELAHTLVADPLFEAARMTLGVVFLSLGRLDEAIVCLREALALSPGFSYARGNLAHAYLLQGKADEALQEFRRAVPTGSARDVAQLAYGLAVTGPPAEARAQLAELLEPERDLHPPPLHIAMAYVGLKEVDEAFRWLRRAVVERDPHVLGLAILPAFRPLRADPRFDALAREIGLVPPASS